MTGDESGSRCRAASAPKDLGIYIECGHVIIV
jgi:hypothetical protein